MPNQSPGGPVLVLDLVFSGDLLEATTHVTSSTGGSLSIDWTSVRTRRGFAPVAGGVLYVRQDNAAHEVTPSLGPQFLGEAPAGALYRWVDASGAALAAVLLPPGFILTRPIDSPPPVAAKVVGERLAVFWVPGGQPIDWLMKPGETRTGAASINGDSPTGGRLPEVPGVIVIVIEPGRSTMRARLVLAAVTALSLWVGWRVAWLAVAPEAGDAGRGLKRVDEGGRDHAAWYERSHALVIGVDTYPSDNWPDLKFARTDARGMAALLKRQGFDVILLLDEDATKEAIIGAMQNDLAPKLASNDRVLVFFAGHGHTEEAAGRDWGYIVPFIPGGGAVQSNRYISMDELEVQSRKMGKAKHQLFIMDACYGGLLGTRSGGVDPARPNYISEILKRTAREVLTAGGKDQQVVDGGPRGHSLFTGYLLEGLEKELADLNGDGYVTFPELVTYIQPLATRPNQVPGHGTLPEHGLGEFVFQVEKPEDSAPASPRAGPGD